ncbi:hypothetical protein C0992_008097, partial [Termitomyces sp. T32_za158]
MALSTLPALPLGKQPGTRPRLGSSCATEEAPHVCTRSRIPTLQRLTEECTELHPPSETEYNDTSDNGLGAPSTVPRHGLPQQVPLQQMPAHQMGHDVRDAPSFVLPRTSMSIPATPFTPHQMPAPRQASPPPAPSPTPRSMSPRAVVQRRAEKQPCPVPPVDVGSFLQDAFQAGFLPAQDLPSHSSRVLPFLPTQSRADVAPAGPTPIAASSAASDEAITLSRLALHSLLQDFRAEVACSLPSTSRKAHAFMAGVSLAPVNSSASSMLGLFRPAVGASAPAPLEVLGTQALQTLGSFALLAGSRPLLGAPPVLSAELDPNIMPILLCIQWVFNMGWVTYIPLDYLTNAACHRVLSASGRQGNSALSLSASGELQVLVAKFDLSRKCHLTAYKFMQAFKTLVWVIWHCLKAGGPMAQAIVQLFKQHYDCIQHRHDFGEQFLVYFT